LPPHLAQRPVSEFLVQWQYGAQTFQDIKEVISVLDLAPTSLWIQTKLKTILENPHLTSDQRAVIREELRKASVHQEYSYEMKNGFEKLILELTPPMQAAPSCRSVF
jgi:hypothetical protein